MNARAAKRLYDAKVVATSLGEYVEGRTQEGFLAGEMWRYAVELQAGRLARAVGASVREATELRERLPGWERIVGLEQCLSLDATTDDLKQLWGVVTRDVPPLLVAIDAELEVFGVPRTDELSAVTPTQVNDLIVRNLVGIAEICKQHGVAKLDMFGSATTGAFADSSDVDFLVRFSPETEKSIGRYMDLEAALGSLLDRKIDLVDDKAFKNPYFEHSVRMTRVPVFQLDSPG